MLNKILITWVGLCLLGIAATRQSTQEKRMWNAIQEGDTLAWSRHITGQDQNDLDDFDEFESIAFVPGDSDAKYEDVGYIVTQREVNDLNVRYIEQFQPLDFGDQNDAWFVDCAGHERYLFHAAVEEVEGEVIWGDYTEYFVLFKATASPPLVNATTEGTIDTSWGDSGYWSYEDGVGYGTAVRPLCQLSDGRLLVSHTYYMATMVNTDGTTDTTWATGGTYTAPNNMNIRVILEDNDGNIHLFGGTVQAGYTYIKLDSDGNLVGGLQKGTDICFWSYDAACWADDEKTIIIAVGDYPTFANMHAIEASTATTYTSWGNQDERPGFADMPEGETGSIYNIIRANDGGFIIHRNKSKLLAKALADGSGLDTSWGDNGELEFNNAYYGYGDVETFTQDDNGNVYVFSRKDVDGDLNCILNKIDEDGGLVNTHNIITLNQYTYHSLSLINNKLYVGTTGASPANYQIEVWSLDLEYESGFDVSGNPTIIYWILPDEYTREYEETVAVEAQDAYVETVDVNYTHLEGRYVCVFADGEPLGTYLVQDSNLVGIDPNEYTTFLAGLNYYSIYESFPILGVKDHRANIQRVALDLYETYGLNLGVDMDNSSEIDFSQMETDYKIAEFPRGTTREPIVYLWVWEPTPFTLRGYYILEEIYMDR